MLHDNYGVAYYPYNPPIMIDSYYIPNCDNNAGCPKWCNGNPTPPFEMDCANYSNEEECNEHSQTQDCLWLDHEDPYFQVRCIKNTDPQNHNIGTDCMEDTGCYWGCSGAGYRPGEDNNFANRFTQRIDILSRKHTYDPVSERFVQDIFDCCYPGNCSNYNYTYCSDFSERYWEYGMCNTCEGETAGVSNPPTINTNTNTQSGLFGWFKSIFG
jgi:hypothetical protein